MRAYRNRVSGPLLDRIDLRARLAPISRAILTAGATGEPSASVRERVEIARDRAGRRLRGTPWATNAELPGPVLRTRFPLPSDALGSLRIDTDRGQLSSRGVERVMKVAWTLADLAGHDVPDLGDVDAARSLRYGAEAAALARSA
jgi:magnesium chelatase family protein